MSLDILNYQGNMILQLASYSLKQPVYCKNVSFGHFPLSNCKGLAHLINKVKQSNRVVMQNGKAV